MQKGLMWGSVVVAAAATFAPDAFGYYALVLVVLGLVMGFTNPIEDVATRVAMYVLAVLLPTIADNLDVFGVAGEYLNGILSQFAVVIAGVAIMQVCLVLKNGLMAAGDDSGDDDSDDGAAEPEAPSWGGDNSGDDDSDDGAAEPEATEPEATEPEATEPEAAEPEAPSRGGDNSGDDDSDDGAAEAEDTRNV